MSVSGFFDLLRIAGGRSPRLIASHLATPPPLAEAVYRRTQTRHVNVALRWRATP
jgi:hypothetical protein